MTVISDRELDRCRARIQTADKQLAKIEAGCTAAERAVFMDVGVSLLRWALQRMRMETE